MSIRCRFRRASYVRLDIITFSHAERQSFQQHLTLLARSSIFSGRSSSTLSQRHTVDRLQALYRTPVNQTGAMEKVREFMYFL